MIDHLIVRADAGPAIGTGHLMRCLALAEAWRADGGQGTFLSVIKTEALRQRVADAGHALIELPAAYPDPGDLSRTLAFVTRSPGAALVLDGYLFDAEYQRRAKKAADRLLVLDDFQHADHYYADIVVNQNAGAENLAYPREPYTQTLLGPAYVLLRSEFTAYSDWQRAIPRRARRLLITFGGSDVDNVTSAALDALAALNDPEIETTVVVGASNPNRAAIEQAVAEAGTPARLVNNPEDIASLMAWADIAIGAGGTTCYELAFMGLPAIVFVLAENQQSVAKALHDAGVVRSLGRADSCATPTLAQALRLLIKDTETRQAMSKRGRALVDGDGARRVVRRLRNEAPLPQPQSGRVP